MPNNWYHYYFIHCNEYKPIAFKNTEVQPYLHVNLVSSSRSRKAMTLQWIVMMRQGNQKQITKGIFSLPLHFWI